MCGCNRWKTGCENCPQKKEYPSSVVFSRARRNYERKKKSFLGVKNLELITPSKWLADLTRQSFLNCYTVEVQHNTIDHSIFKPTPSEFRENHGIQGKMVLGVSAVWDERKGLEDFIRLATERKDVTVVLVGLSDAQMKMLPPQILGIKKTNSAAELAAIYTAADVFFLPTREDNYPTVCLEAEACGTRVVTYDIGGSKETIFRDDSVAVKGFDEALMVI